MFLGVKETSGITWIKRSCWYPYLTHFSLIFYFYTPFGFLTFSGSIEMEHLAKMD